MSYLLAPVALACLFASGARAAESAPEATEATFTVTGTVASQYVSRGLRQSWGKPALQAGADYLHPGGFSAGTWVSTVSSRFIEDATLEWDLYAGYAGSAGAVGYSAQVIYYVYPGAEYSATSTTYNYGELVLGLSYQGWHARYMHTFTREFFGIANARGTGYLDLGAAIDLGSGLTLILHAGNGRVAGDGNAIWNWRDAKLGISKSLPGNWSATAAYTRAWGKSDAYAQYTLGIPNRAGVIEMADVGKGTLAVSITKTF